MGTTAKILPLPKQASRGRGATSLIQARLLPDDEVRKLLQKFSHSKSEKDYRNRALVLVMLSTGLRAKEIVNLKFSDEITTFQGKKGYRYYPKGRRRQLVTIPSEAAMKAVKVYHEHIGIKSDSFFLSLPSNANKVRGPITTRSLQRIVKDWGVYRADNEQATPHAMRHTAGQRVFLKSGSIAAQKLLGHATPIVTSKFYTLPYYDAEDELTW